MKKNINLILLGFIMVLLSGCNTTGLSMRERGSFNYSNFIYGLYDKENAVEKEKKNVNKPIKLAVAQVGENTPSQTVIDQLMDERHLFSKVVSLPVGGAEPQYYGNEKTDNTVKFEEKMVRMRRLAKDLDVDYIFLFGGSADYGSTPNWLQMFDLTIVGGFILPSNKINAEGRAAGALIDVATGQVILIVNSEAKKQESVPTFMVDGQQEKVVVKLRDDLVTSLTKEFVEKMYSL